MRPPVNIGTTVRIQRFRKYVQNWAQKNEGRQVDISSLLALEGGGGKVSRREKAWVYYRLPGHVFFS